MAGTRIDPRSVSPHLLLTARLPSREHQDPSFAKEELRHNGVQQLPKRDVNPSEQRDPYTPRGSSLPSGEGEERDAIMNAWFTPADQCSGFPGR